jgi:hypothetical protein
LGEYVGHRHDWEAHRLRLFDGDGNGTLDREERTAAGYFDRKLYDFEIERGNRAIEFLVVERSIPISVR